MSSAETRIRAATLAERAILGDGGIHRGNDQERPRKERSLLTVMIGFGDESHGCDAEKPESTPVQTCLGDPTMTDAGLGARKGQMPDVDPTDAFASAFEAPSLPFNGQQRDFSTEAHLEETYLL